MLKFILLGFLNYKVMTGYELKRLIELSTGHFWHAYHSQIYTTLRKMEADGLVISEFEGEEDKLERRLYTLSAAGSEDLQHWLAQPLTELPRSKDDLLVRLFFSASRDKAEILDELRFQRALHRQQLALYAEIDVAANAALMEAESGKDFRWESQFWHFTIEHGIAHEAMYLEWLDNTIEWLEKN